METDRDSTSLQDSAPLRSAQVDARGYFRKRTHNVLGGLQGRWHFAYVALCGDWLFYARHVPCLNAHGGFCLDPAVVYEGGTRAAGPVKKVSLHDFDLFLDETPAASDPAFLDKRRTTGTITLTPRGVTGRHPGWKLQLQAVRGPDDTRAFFEALEARGPRAARRLARERGGD